jgi:hypothetical protein
MYVSHLLREESKRERELQITDQSDSELSNDGSHCQGITELSGDSSSVNEWPKDLKKDDISESRKSAAVSRSSRRNGENSPT